MRTFMVFAGAMLLALASSAAMADPVRDAGSKIRGDMTGAANGGNGSMVYRSYSVAPTPAAPAAQSAPAAPAMQPAPAAQPAPAVTRSAPTRSFSYQATQPVYNYSRQVSQPAMAPYLRADHKIKADF